MAIGLLLFLTACSSPAPRTTAATSPLSPLPPPAPTAEPLALTIVHSNDSWGYLDPCG